MEKEIDIKDLHYSYDLKNCNFEIDALQEEMLNAYIRTDPKFRMAFHTDYTPIFLNYLRDKQRLREPTHLSVKGITRSSKSTTMASVCALHQAFLGKKFTTEYVCSNSQVFLQKVKEMPKEKVVDRVFLIDEEKGAMYNFGSMAKKQKLLDVNNIVAKNNISTISLCPTQFSNPYAHYGLSTLGRDRKNKINRLILYNLQEGGINHAPMGMLYLPPIAIHDEKTQTFSYDHFVPYDYGKEFIISYEHMKDTWIDKEREGSGDILAEMRRNKAKEFMNDPIFKQITKKNEKIAYIGNILGSEFTSKEVENIFYLTKLLSQDFIK
jgi:hypothetical protein